MKRILSLIVACFLCPPLTVFAIPPGGEAPKTLMFPVFSMGIDQKPSAGQTHRFVATFPITIPAGLTGTQAKCAVASSTGDVVLTLKDKTGSTVGTITFAQTTGVATLAAASAISLAAGDWLDLVWPNPADAAFAGPTISIAANRS